MTPPPPPRRSRPNQQQAEFHRLIKSKSERKLKARKEGDRSLWFGLGFAGLVGWSVAVPTLLGMAIGIWIDARWESQYSWTLMLMLLGVLIGCLNAWYWVQQESHHD